MPHDRLYFDEKSGDLTSMCQVTISQDSEGKEVLSESKVPISDEMCKLFVDLYKTQPSLDHISANKILKNEGFFKRLQDMMW